MADCKCGDITLGNTGVASCLPVAKTTKKIFYMTTFASDGTLNKIDSAQVIDQAFIDGLINAAHPYDRIYPIADNNLNAVTNVRSESKYATKDDDSKTFLFEGAKSFTAEEWEKSSIYLGQLKTFGCEQFSAFLLDVAGNFRYSKHAGSDDRFPIKIAKGSLEIKYVEPLADSVEKIVHSFDWDVSEKDENLRMIQGGDITANLKNANGLISVNSLNSNITTAGFTIELNTIFGTKATGLLLADFVVNELTPTPGGVALTSVVETAIGSGIYDIVFTVAETSGDVLECVITKSGGDFTAVRANTILIP